MIEARQSITRFLGNATVKRLMLQKCYVCYALTATNDDMHICHEDGSHTGYYLKGRAKAFDYATNARHNLKSAF